MLPGKLIWYSWHPFFMVLAFVPLSINAILLKKIGGYENTKAHGTLMLLSTLAAGFAFYVIYSNKNMNKKPHFKSPHGQSGLVILVLYGSLALVGMVGLNPDFGVFRTNKTVRFVHKWLGKMVSVLTWIVMIWQFITFSPNTIAKVCLTLPLAAFGFYAML
jgi:hypothetical protein